MLSRLGLIGRIWSVTHQGKGVSLNFFYQQRGHWGARQKVKNQYKGIFSTLIAECKANDGLCSIDQYYLLIFYNSRHDPDNVAGTSKMFVDSLRDAKIIKDDSKKYCKGYMVFPDQTLPHNTFEMILIENGN
jgi:hypothetical protein